MQELFATIEGSNVSTWLRESNTIWAYPLVLTLHTVGLALLVGANTTLDLRLEKVFNVMNNRFGIYADIENVANASTVISVLTRVPGTDVSTSSGTVTLPFGTPGTLTTPRQIRIGGRWSF